MRKKYWNTITGILKIPLQYLTNKLDKCKWYNYYSLLTSHEITSMNLPIYTYLVRYCNGIFSIFHSKYLWWEFKSFFIIYWNFGLSLELYGTVDRVPFCLRGSIWCIRSDAGTYKHQSGTQCKDFWSFRKYNAEIYFYPRFYSIWGLLRG